VPVSRLAPHAGLDDVLVVAATEANTENDVAAFAAALTEVLS
jgi:glycine dehydrogenase subunit 1